MSAVNVRHPLIGLIASKSTPIFMLAIGIYLAATYNLLNMKIMITYQPPGAAQRSTSTFALLRKSYFLLSYISLYAALDLKPCSLAM